MKITTRQCITVHDFDQLVSETYGRPYNFQQQDGCKMRGTEYVSVPAETEDFEAETVPEVVNHGTMGVSFKAWLERDPTKFLPDREDHSWLAELPQADADRSRQMSLNLWWERNFYPHVSMVLNDLHARGLIEPGEYAIEIDW